MWDVSSREKLASKSFQVWDIGASSMVLKVCSFLTNLSFVKIVVPSSGCLNSILILVKFRHPYSKTHLSQLNAYYGVLMLLYLVRLKNAGSNSFL